MNQLTDIEPITPEQRKSFLSRYPYIGEGKYDLSHDIESEFIAQPLLQKEQKRILALDLTQEHRFAYYDILKICKFNGYSLVGYNPVKNPTQDELSMHEFVFNELSMGYPSAINGVILFKLIGGEQAIKGHLIYQTTKKLQLQLL